MLMGHTYPTFLNTVCTPLCFWICQDETLLMFFLVQTDCVFHLYASVTSIPSCRDGNMVWSDYNVNVAYISHISRYHLHPTLLLDLQGRDTSHVFLVHIDCVFRLYGHLSHLYQAAETVIQSGQSTTTAIKSPNPTCGSCRWTDLVKTPKQWWALSPGTFRSKLGPEL